MDTLLQDIRYGVRSLLSHRGFAIAALVCLALGVGINTALFTFVNAILLRPLPIREAERVVSVFWTNYDRGIDDGGISFGDLEDFRATGLFDELGGVAIRGVTLTGGDQPERVRAASVTPEVLPLIGAVPVEGRLFRPEDAAPMGFEQSVVLSHATWQRQFGGAAGVVGRTLEINGRALTVIGIMPAGFRFPEREELWLPLAPAQANERENRYLWGLGRLREGVSVASADARVREIGERIRSQEAENVDQVAASVLGYREAVVDAPARRALWLMLGAVALVLLIACANVANLLLARAADRRRELALRTALGASRLRVIRQLLTESLLLALAGAGLGILIAIWWIDAIASRIPEDLAYWITFDMDATVLLYTAALAATSALLFGAIPALHGSRGDLHSDLKQAGRTTGPRDAFRVRNALVVGEIALSLVLLVAAVLMMQSFMTVMRASPGFDERGMLTMRATLVGDRHDDPLARAEFWQHTAERLRAVPGITGAAITSAIPADDGGPTAMVQLPGAGESGSVMVMEFGSTTGWFGALGVELLAGRDFRPEEVRDTAARVAILGRTLAQRLFPAGDVVGRTIRVGPARLEHTIIGVAPDIQYDEFGEDESGTRHQLHLPYAQLPWRGMNVIVRGAGDVAALAAPVREALRAADPLLVPYEVMTFEERREFTQWNVQLLGNAFGSFGILALLLALAGIYGVMAYAVARRRHELGIRLALGASPRGVVALMLGRSARLTALGLAIGIAGALAVGRLLQTLLYEVHSQDPLTLAGVTLALAAAALLAAWLPSRRAARADPLEALRAE